MGDLYLLPFNMNMSGNPYNVNSIRQSSNDIMNFCSYNVKDFNPTKYETIRNLFHENTFLLIQETWLSEDEFINRFKNEFPESECISANKMDTGEIRAGRRHGGVGICYHNKVKCKIENISTTSKCICAQKIIIDEMCILVINVYMPCSDNRVDLDEYASILQEISILCIKIATPHIIIGGDWNADLTRNDGRTKLFREFIAQENLYNPLNLEISNVPYTFSCAKPDDTVSYSTIDHFLISPGLANTVDQYEISTQYGNGSDHVPLILNLNINLEFHKTSKREFKPCVQWYKCDENDIRNYKNTLDHSLLTINPNHDALKCKQYKCTRHSEYIQDLYSNIISNTSNSSKSTLPHTSRKKVRKVIPGWNEHVKEHSERAKLWHEIWVQMGRPREGYLANIRRKTRLRYHYAIRKIVRNETKLRNDKFAEAISNNDDRALWDEVRKISKVNNDLPIAMDGHSNTDEITDIFADKYKTLYNSVSYNKHELKRLTADIDSRIDNSCPNNTAIHPHSITVQDVKKAIIDLKQGKKEENGLYTNHFINGTDRLFILITLLFNCMLIHGIAPDDLLLGTMIPLIKNSRGNKQCSDNYRSLTIGTGLSKLLDIVILNQQAAKLKTSDQQFGFKEKSSTTMCTFAALETIEHYKSNGGYVHTLLLDASKAFDRVDYIKMFDKLLDRGMCPLTVRLLLNMYTKQKLQVKWDNCISHKFDVTNGVRQGGILSPILFTVYVDELLIKLKSNGIGCHMGNQFVGALGYADDIILLSPTVAGLKKMISICEEYAKEHSIMFNGSKSKYLVFGNYKYNPNIKVNDENVSRCDSALYLGHLLHTKNTTNEIIDHAIKEFKKSYYGFISKFESCYNSTKNKLFHQYCCSMYGSQLWDKTGTTIENMYTQWRKAHRQVLSVPYMTHCDLLPLIANNMPLEYILDSRYFAFFNSIVNSKNEIISHTASSKIFDCSSTLGRNITHLMHKYDLVIEDMLSLSKQKIKNLCLNKWMSGIKDEYPMYAQIIKDMILMKEGNDAKIFSNDECNCIIDFCCITND